MTTTNAPAKLDHDDPRSVFAKSVSTADIAIAAVRPDQMTNPTPCGDYDVRALLGHLLFVLDRVARVGRNENPFAGPDTVDPLPDDAWLAAWTERARVARDAWTDDAALVRPTPLPWAPESGAQALGTYIAEVTVHTWDLATAIGHTPDWDHHVLAAGLKAMRGALPAVGRKEMFAAIRAQMGLSEAQMGDPYGPAVAVDGDAPLIDQLVAYNGRTAR